MTATSSSSFLAVVPSDHCSTLAARHDDTIHQVPIFSSSLPSSSSLSYMLNHAHTVPVDTSCRLTCTTPLQSRTEPSVLRPSMRWCSLLDCGQSTSPTSTLNASVFSTATTTASPPLRSTVSLPVSSPRHLSTSDTDNASLPASPYCPRVNRSYLPSSERKVRCKAKHRHFDHMRRSRELAALAQLKQLLSLPSADSSRDRISIVVGEGAPRAVSASVDGHGTTDGKATVLERAVEELTRLRKVIAVQRAIMAELAAQRHQPVHSSPPPAALSSAWPAVFNNHTGHHSLPDAAAQPFALPLSTTSASASIPIHSRLSRASSILP